MLKDARPPWKRSWTRRRLPRRGESHGAGPTNCRETLRQDGTDVISVASFLQGKSAQWGGGSRAHTELSQTCRPSGLKTHIRMPQPPAGRQRAVSYMSQFLKFPTESERRTSPVQLASSPLGSILRVSSALASQLTVHPSR